MKKVQSQLKSIAKSLAALTKQVETVSKQLSKPQPAKKTVAKKAVPKKAAAKKTAPKKAAAKKVAPKKARTKKAAPKKPVAKKAASAKKLSVLDNVLGVIKRSRKGVDISTLKEKTALDKRQLSNALYKLSKRGVIVSKSRGVYIKA